MEEKKLKILGIQMSSKLGDKEANFSKVRDLIEKNIQQDTDIIVLPEVWTLGWKPSEFENSAEDLNNSETVNFLSQIAQAYNVNIIGGSFIVKEPNIQTSKPPTLHNTCPIINRNGELVAHYNKMHLFSYYGCDEGKFVKKGSNPVMIDIKGVKIGLTICYDIRFPEIYRAYRKAGADLLINMAAWPMSRAVHWEALSKARAIENQCFMVALTQSGLIEGEEWNLGHSRIIDYDGEVISEVKEGEGAMFAEIKFEEMYEFRKKCTVLLDIHDKYEVE
ncbi:MAG: nitrilase-related carbon-nitrogen hydrolase [Candidatus Gastranaerophilaceae bacterium]